jgi:GMP synthase-like glutamine amidotransferase
VARVAVLHHVDRPFTGFAGDALRAAGVDLDERDLLAGDDLPRLDDVDGILTLGGEQSARDLERYDYLRAEAALLREAVGARVPVFGGCLGGQMLARALGAEVRRMPRRMIAWPATEPLPAAAEDPVFSAWPAGTRTLHWHEDEFDLPARGVELMARAGPGVEAFRHGDLAWGIQFHPETDVDTYEHWCRTAQPGELEEAGVTLDDLRAAIRAHIAEQERAALALFGAFAAVVTARSESIGRRSAPGSRTV